MDRKYTSRCTAPTLAERFETNRDTLRTEPRHRANAVTSARWFAAAVVAISTLSLTIFGCGGSGGSTGRPSDGASGSEQTGSGGDDTNGSGGKANDDLGSGGEKQAGGRGGAGGHEKPVSTNGGRQEVPVSGTGGDDVVIDTTPDAEPPNERNLPIRKKVCDSAGKCTCLRLALLGTLESAANAKDTKPFTDWLNGNSDGTATVTMISKQPKLDAAFLADYDILLVANVNTWTFSDAEKAAVAQWVRETGGGIITLTGFLSEDAEPSATSQLLEFAKIRYKAPKAAENGQNKPVYYKDGTVDLKNCLAWTESSDAIITTPIHFEPLTGSLASLTFELDYVGAFIGWGIEAPAEATVVAKDPVSGGNIAVAYEFEGKGRIFAFGDEWVIFANQWQPAGQPSNKQEDQYNICWQLPTDDAAGFHHSVKTLYQTKQFWYDIINWVAPPNECNFVVKDPDVVVVPIK